MVAYRMKSALVKILWRQALKNLEVSEKLLEEGFYNFSAFHAHQAAEYALKTAIVFLLRELPPKTHFLPELLSALQDEGIEVEDIREDTLDLNLHYRISLDPEALGGPPYETYSRRMGKLCLMWARRILKWTEKHLQK